MEPVAVTIALDWSPNTNHIGFYIAKAKGFYSESNLAVTLLSTHHDDYARTPASRVFDGSVMFAVSPSETVISSHTSPSSETIFPLVAVAALQLVDSSAIVTLASGGIGTPADLDGKVYASSGARYEGRIVQELIKRDGGSGVFKEVVPTGGSLHCWESFLGRHADAVWIFLGWEGIDAKRCGIELNVFPLEEIPYGYSPVLVADPKRLALAANATTTRAFLAASARGFAFAAAHPEEAARLFFDVATAENPDLPRPLNLDMCIESTRFLADCGTWKGAWGRMEPARWLEFVGWLHSTGLLTSARQSRTPNVVANTVSLDDLRQGNSGELLPLLDSTVLFSNAFF